MSDKPKDIGGYSQDLTEDCERVLVTLLNGFGPWKDSVYLVGGLAPRYILPPDPERPVHGGTSDVDIVVRMAVLADTKAYQTLEENLTKLKFVQAPRPDGGLYSFRWQVLTDHGHTIHLEFLAGEVDKKAGVLEDLPVKGRKLSACNFPALHLVQHFYETREVKAELLNGRGIATETVRYANIVSYLCAKAAALDDRGEEKDAYDLGYCMEYVPTAEIVDKVGMALKTEYAQMIRTQLKVIKSRFCSDAETFGFQKDGPRKAALFELSDDRDPNLDAARILRQREIAAAAEELFQGLGW